MMAQLGVPLPVTRDAVGHMSDTVTRHYTHIHANVARAAVEKIVATAPPPAEPPEPQRSVAAKPTKPVAKPELSTMKADKVETAPEPTTPH